MWGCQAACRPRGDRIPLRAITARRASEARGVCRARRATRPTTASGRSADIVGGFGGRFRQPGRLRRPHVVGAAHFAASLGGSADPMRDCHARGRSGLGSTTDCQVPAAFSADHPPGLKEFWAQGNRPGALDLEGHTLLSARTPSSRAFGL